METPPTLRPVPNNNGTEAKQKPTRSPSTKMRPRRALPTDRMKFHTAIEVVSAFVLASRGGLDAVQSEDLVAHVNLTAATAGLNNIFFMETGFIIREAKGRYKPVEAVVDFHRELGWGEAHATAKLAPILASTWFYAEAERRDELSPMSRADLVAALRSAAKADVSDTPKVEQLVEWLEYVGLVSVEGDHAMVVPLQDVPGVAADRIVTPKQPKEEPEMAPADPKVEESATPSRATARRSPLVLSLTMSVALTVEDLALLSAEQIAELFKGVGDVAAIQAIVSAGNRDRD